MNVGSSNRQLYDNCVYQKNLYEATAPLNFNLFLGKYENCQKCTYNGDYWVRYDPQIVDIETELRNQTRPLSKCDQFKYSPNCQKSGMCISTFDKSVPVVLVPEVCPIIYNNIPRLTDPGYRLPNPNPCAK